MPNFLLNDTNGFTVATQYGQRLPSYPFANAAIPDTLPVAYDRNMRVLVTSYSPQMATRTSVTNLLTYSEQFDNAAWTKTNTDITANSLANPSSGVVTADVMTETSANGVHDAGQLVTMTATPTVFFVFVRAFNGRSWIRMRVVDSAATSFTCFFNIVTGAVGTAGAGTTGTITSLGNLWYMCQIAFTPAAGVGAAYVNLSTDGSTISYAGDTSYGVTLWGAQVSPASGPVAYIATTSATRTGSSPNLEINETTGGADPFAFLVKETEPFMGLMIGRFSRRYARVPGDQITPANRWFNRPVMHNIRSGSSYMVSFDEAQKYSWLFTTRKSISRVSSYNASTAVSAMPSSNIVFVEGGRTLNLPANSSAATVVSQFNSVLTGLTQVSCNVSQGFLSVVWTGAMTSVTPPSGVVVTQLASWIATFSSTGTQTTPATTTFESSAHGGIVGDRCALWAGDALVGTGEVVAVGGSNTFTLMTNSLIAANTLITACAFSSDAAACYVNGPKLCTVKRTQKFYLPGVTTGITTYADIPDVTVYTDPISWLGRILAVPTGYAAIAVSELQPWEGPIMVQETSEVQMSDAIDTVTP